MALQVIVKVDHQAEMARFAVPGDEHMTEQQLDAHDVVVVDPGVRTGMAELAQAAVFARCILASHEFVAFLPLQRLIGQHPEFFPLRLIQVEDIMIIRVDDDGAEFHVVEDFPVEDEVGIAVGQCPVQHLFRMLHAVHEEAHQAVDAADL